MKPEAQRIAIAEACPEIFRMEPAYGFCRLAKIGENSGQIIPCDPLNDLNAMHEAEKVLTEGQWNVYITTLQKVCVKKWSSATAAQRAEAFLRTLGLWKAK